MLLNCNPVRGRGSAKGGHGRHRRRREAAEGDAGLGLPREAPRAQDADHGLRVQQSQVCTMGLIPTVVVEGILTI